MTTASLIAVTCSLPGMKRSPKLAILDWCKMKVLRENTDDLVRQLIQCYRLTDNLSFTTKKFLPRRIADDHRARCFRQILAGIKIATEDWSDAERMKKAVTDTRARSQFHARACAHHKPALTI